jgi:trans-aconitate 2-methyltransferase
VTVGERFARFATTVTVRAPFVWRVLRGPRWRSFDRLAPEWNTTRAAPNRLVPIERALEVIPDAPTRVLDLGTGSGAVARAVAARWPEADVVGADSSPRMVDEARRLASTPRERYDVADAAALPYPDGSFDAVLLNNMIPFFDEIARVTAPGGVVAIAYSLGSRTPIWVPLDRVRRELERRGFAHVADFSAGPGVSLLARKDDRS